MDQHVWMDGMDSTFSRSIPPSQFCPQFLPTLSTLSTQTLHIPRSSLPQLPRRCPGGRVFETIQGYNWLVSTPKVKVSGSPKLLSRKSPKTPRDKRNHPGKSPELLTSFCPPKSLRHLRACSFTSPHLVPVTWQHFSIPIIKGPLTAPLSLLSPP